MEFANWLWPQWTFMILTFLEFVIFVSKHGESRGTYNGVVTSRFLIKDAKCFFSSSDLSIICCMTPSTIQRLTLARRCRIVSNIRFRPVSLLSCYVRHHDNIRIRVSRNCLQPLTLFLVQHPLKDGAEVQMVYRNNNREARQRGEGVFCPQGV